MQSDYWHMKARWCALALTFAGCVDGRKSSEHTSSATSDTARRTGAVPALSAQPYSGAESAGIDPPTPLPSALASVATGTLAHVESARTSVTTNNSESALGDASLPTLNVTPEVYEQLTQVAVEWHGTLSGWGKRLLFPSEGKPERLLDGQGGSMRLLTVPPTSLWVERRWDGGGIDVHHFESSALPEGWKLYFVDNVTKIHASDPRPSGNWNKLSLSKTENGYVELFLEAWPINIKDGVAFRPRTDELFPLVFIGNARSQPSLWAAFDAHCPASDEHTARDKSPEHRNTASSAVSPRRERHCVLMGSAAHVNNTLMRHAGTKRIWELSTWMDPN